MKIGNLYFHIRFKKPHYCEPESGDGMWQLDLGFLTITHMGDGPSFVTSQRVDNREGES